MQRQYTVGKAQQMVLDVLGWTATGSSDADQQFEKIGIVVTAKREGRSVVPQIVVKARTGGGMDYSAGYGEGYSANLYRKLTVAEYETIKQWIVKLPSNSVETAEVEPELDETEYVPELDETDRIEAELADRQRERLNEVMTASEVAQEFGLAEATVRQAINRGQVFARKSAGTWLVLRGDAEYQWSKRS
jgi:hypothetical protein